MYLKEVSSDVREKIKMLDEIRKATRHLIHIQTEGCSEEELTSGQSTLNNLYDKYVKVHGVLIAIVFDAHFFKLFNATFTHIIHPSR